MAQIRHLAILTGNVERLVKFYTEAFGMKVVEGVCGGLGPVCIGRMVP